MNNTIKTNDKFYKSIAVVFLILFSLFIIMQFYFINSINAMGNKLEKIETVIEKNNDQSDIEDSLYNISESLLEISKDTDLLWNILDEEFNL